MAGMLEMLSDKGMTCSGQMEAMTNDGYEEGHFHRTIGKPRLGCSLPAPANSKKPLWNSFYTGLLATSRENTPEVSGCWTLVCHLYILEVTPGELSHRTL